MTVSYNGLWKLLIDKNLTRKDFFIPYVVDNDLSQQLHCNNEMARMIMSILKELRKYVDTEIKMKKEIQIYECFYLL